MPKPVRLLAFAWMFALGCGGPGGSQNNLFHRDGGPSLAGHLDPNPGAAGASCQTACDCQDGLGCTSGKCSASASATYCCSSSGCPSGAACQSSNGSISSCGGGPPPGQDAGAPPPPPPPPPPIGDGGILPICGLLMLPCTTDADCTSTPFGCTSCDPINLVCM